MFKIDHDQLRLAICILGGSQFKIHSGLSDKELVMLGITPEFEENSSQEEILNAAYLSAERIFFDAIVGLEARIEEVSNHSDGDAW